MKMINLNNIKIGAKNPIIVIAGPCVIENEDITLSTAIRIKKLSENLNFPFIFKSSYKKANRTSFKSFSTIGIEESLRILEKVKKEINSPILTDIHTIEEIKIVKEVADILQIPAFLCRQTDLLIEAGKSNKVINIKKGQFLSPGEMKHAAEKVKSTGNEKIMLTERGTFFGYNDLVVDMRSLKIMKELGYPVIFDATHSVQQPGKDDRSSGLPEFIFPLARAATAAGIDGIFIETHPDPINALSDAASQLPLLDLESLLSQVLQIDRLVKEFLI
jgi:2-dehydro-3-deoxyphosphooctonate aldolase (KDO 8-P synthase)